MLGARMRQSSRNISRLIAAAAAAVVVGAAASASAEDAALGRAGAAIARGDYPLAEKELAGVQGADRGKALLEQARLQYVTGRYADAIATAKTAAGSSREARAEAAAIRAEALAANGKTAEAIAACKEVESEPSARRARVILGELLIKTGKRAQARAPLLTLVDDYNNDKINDKDPRGLALVGRAAFLLRSAHDANDAFKEAEKAGAKNMVQPLLWESELFLDKYDPGHAGEAIKQALKLAPKDPFAHLAMAKARLDSGLDFDGAESDVTQALEVNPNLASAYGIRAGLALRDLDIAAADKAVDAGLKINPSDLELLSTKAAIRFLADDPAGYETWKKKTFAVDPEYSTFYQIVGEYAEWEHRYDDLVKMMKEATQVDPSDGKAFAALGMNLIRAGDDTGGLAALRSAWTKDKFNVRVYNTLNLFEKTIATDYVTVSGTTFNIRYNKEDKAILERYVPRMLDEAWASMVKRYGFTPKTPVSIELYADEESFSLRTAGLPHVGIQGVCFGQTLAAMSPSAQPFNWGNVLWHELGHVFAIQMSKNHVPRWFTEGLSEYETIIRRPEWQREEDPALFAALKGGRIPEVASFNRAFTHVNDVSDVTMAYYAASQIQVFLAQEFGFPKMVAMLPKWAAGERTPEVVKETLGITSDELDRRFKKWLEPHLVRYTKQYVPDLHAPPLDEARKAVKAEPKNAKRYVALALALLGDHQGAEADAMLDEALRIDPKEPNAHFVRLKMAIGKKDATEAARLVNKMIADGNDGYAIRMMAADLTEQRKDVAATKKNLEAASAFDPSQDEPLQGLYDIAHKANDSTTELAVLEKLAMLDQHDRKVWGLLLQKLLDVGRWEDARKAGESALFIDVQNPKIHTNYARALARTGRFVTAVYELNSALVCHPKLKEQAAIYGELATAYDKLKQPAFAAEAKKYQQQIASSPAAKEPDGPPRRRGAPKDTDGT